MSFGIHDHVDCYADVATASAAAHSAADVTTYVNKIIKYDAPSALVAAKIGLSIWVG